MSNDVCARAAVSASFCLCACACVFVCAHAQYYFSGSTRWDVLPLPTICFTLLVVITQSAFPFEVFVVIHSWDRVFE